MNSNYNLFIFKNGTIYSYNYLVQPTGYDNVSFELDRIVNAKSLKIKEQSSNILEQKDDPNLKVANDILEVFSPKTTKIKSITNSDSSIILNPLETTQE